MSLVRSKCDNKKVFECKQASTKGKKSLIHRNQKFQWDFLENDRKLKIDIFGNRKYLTEYFIYEPRHVISNNVAF